MQLKREQDREKERLNDVKLQNDYAKLMDEMEAKRTKELQRIKAIGEGHYQGTYL